MFHFSSWTEQHTNTTPLPSQQQGFYTSAIRMVLKVVFALSIGKGRGVVFVCCSVQEEK